MYNEHKKEISGAQADTTNNRMELTAAIQGLELLKEPCRVDVYTDSTYLCNAFVHRWIDGWQRNGWQTSGKKPVENQDLWRALLRLTQIHIVQWHKVKGHSDNPWNNRCDKLAVTAAKGLEKARNP